MVEQMTVGKNHFIIDFMRLEVCKMNRSNRPATCTEDIQTSPNDGYCSSQQMHSYGYKLHAVCSATKQKYQQPQNRLNAPRVNKEPLYK